MPPVSTFEWSIQERPAGSAAVIDADDLGAARFVADQEGPYRVELRVHEGRLWSLPASMLVVAMPAPRSAPMVKSPSNDRMGGGMKEPATPAKKVPFLKRRIKTEQFARAKSSHFH